MLSQLVAFLFPQELALVSHSTQPSAGHGSP